MEKEFYHLVGQQSCMSHPPPSVIHAFRQRAALAASRRSENLGYSCTSTPAGYLGIGHLSLASGCYTKILPLACALHTGDLGDSDTCIQCSASHPLDHTSLACFTTPSLSRHHSRPFLSQNVRLTREPGRRGREIASLCLSSLVIACARLHAFCKDVCRLGRHLAVDLAVI